MSKQTFLVLVSTILMLVTTLALLECAAAEADFNAYSGAAIDDSKIDGNIGSEWDDAGKATGVAINPQGTADVWTKNDGTNLYIAIRFTADSNDPWVAVQLGGNSCMEAGADLALFGNNLPQFSKDGYVDGYMGGTGAAKPDATQNGKGALNVTSQNVVTVELKKPLNSGDIAGNDINWAQNQTQTLVVIWNSDNFGSSGGTTSHYRNGLELGTAIVRTLLINSNSMAQSGNPILANIDTNTLIILVAILVVAVVAVILVVFLVRKRGSKTKP